MFLIQKYTQYKAAQAEQQKRKVTEKELAQLNHKIDKLLTKLDEHEPEIAANQDEECVVCVNAKATMQTYPCGHRVVCRKCFVKTIQMAVAQRLLPLRCVICRAKILRLKHSNGAMSLGPLPSSASQYTMSSSSSQQWYHVPQSASLYSVTSNTSGVSSASSCSSASSYKTCASSFSAASLRNKAYNSSYTKMGYKPLRTSSPSPSRSPQTRSGLAASLAKKDNKVAPAEVVPLPPAKGKLTLIQEFKREFQNGIEGKTPSGAAVPKGVTRHSSDVGSSRIKCARQLVNQASCCSTPSGDSANVKFPGKTGETTPIKSPEAVLGSKSFPSPSTHSLPSLRLSRTTSSASGTSNTSEKSKKSSNNAPTSAKSSGTKSSSVGRSLSLCSKAKTPLSPTSTKATSKK